MNILQGYSALAHLLGSQRSSTTAGRVPDMGAENGSCGGVGGEGGPEEGWGEGRLPVQGCLWPWLEPVNDGGVDGGQEALASHTEVGSYRAGCEHHVKVVAHLKTTQDCNLSGHARRRNSRYVCIEDLNPASTQVASLGMSSMAS